MAKDKKKVIKPEKSPTMASSWLVFLLDVVVIMLGVAVLKLDAQIALLGAIIVTCLYGHFLHISFDDMTKSMISSVTESVGAIFLLLSIGPLIAAWIACGSVPYIIYLGLGLISPSWFLAFVVFICCLLSFVTGSSWTTIGTVGVACIGIAIGMGIPLPLTAGAIVCGAYFGDKCSPISDVVVFNSGITKVPIMKHARYVLITTGPAILITLGIFFVIGLQYSSQSVDEEAILAIREGLSSVYNFSPVLWIPVLAVVVAIALKVPAVPSLLLGAFVGIITAVLTQGVALADALGYLFNGFSIETGIEDIDKILNRGGMTSMMYVISIVLCSMSLAGTFDRTQLLSTIVKSFGRITKTRAGLMVTTLFTGIVTSFVAADPYISAMIPTKAYEDEYDNQGLDRSVLSRTVSDGGICFAPMVPWGSNGVFCSQTMGLSVMSYNKFYFMGMLTPLISILFAFIGIGVKYVSDEAKKAAKEKRPYDPSADPADNPEVEYLKQRAKGLAAKETEAAEA